MPTPSLLIVPARFKSGKLYSQIPTSGAGDFTVTRATAATRVNASGFIESMASGIPRLDYFASGGVVGCPALLVEPSAQNLAFHSENWVGGSNWDLSNGVTRTTGSTDAFIAPDGTFTANAISPTSGNVIHLAQSNGTTLITFTSGTIYTQSAFFKAGGTNLPVSGNAGRYVQLTFASTRFTQLGFANFDLQNGVVAASGGTTDTNRNARIENYGNGWYRCSLTATCNASGTGVGVVPTLITASGSTRVPTFSGTVTDVLYGWGAQLETGSVATSYIPTTTGSVTRNAEVVSVSGAVSGSIGQTEGVLYIECESNDGLDDVFFINRSTANAIYLVKLANNSYVGRIRHSTTNTISFTSASGITGMVKIAIAYKSGDSTMYLNGSRVGVLSTTAITFNGALNTVGVYKTPFFEGAKPSRIRAVALYNTRLLDDELATLTTP